MMDYFLRYLNAIHREDDESDEDYVSRIEKSIAESLGFQTSSFTAADKVSSFLVTSSIRIY